MIITVPQSSAFLALSCAGVLSTSPALAAPAGGEPVAAGTATAEADAQANRNPDDIVVNGERERRSADPKAVAPLVDTPRSIVVLPAAVIEQTGSATLTEALRTVPGITFGAAEGGNPVGDRPFIRGFDSQGSTFVDGVRDTAAQSREVFAVEQIQVVRGSDGTLGGRGSAGGSINIITKMPKLDTFAQASGSYGEADYKRLTADVNVQLGDMAAVRVAGAWHDQDVAGRDAIWQKRWGIAPSIAIGLGTPTRLSINYYHLTTEELPDSGIPYLYTLANAPLGTTRNEPAVGRVTTANGTVGRVDRSTFYGLRNRDFRDTKTDQAMMRVEHDFGTLTVRNSSRYSHNSQQYIFTQPDDSQGNVFGVGTAAPASGGGLVWRRANTRYGYVETLANQTDLFGKVMTGGIEHSIAIGAELLWEKARRGTFVVTTSPRCTAEGIARFNCTSLFAPNPNDPWVNYASDTSNMATPITRTPITGETQNESRTRGVYAFDSITFLPQLILNLGARFDNFRSTVTPPSTTGTFELTREDDIFNWQAGLVFKPTPTTSVYASYATSATPPNSLVGEGQEGNSLGTTNTPAALLLLDSLKVEKSKSYEIGAKADLMGGRLSLGLAGFRTETANARVTGPGNTIEFIGKRRIQGAEFTASGTILPGWTIFGGYTYLDAKIVDGGFTALTAPAVGTRPAQTVLVPAANTGRPAPQAAKHNLSIWTNATLFDRVEIGGGAFYQSRVYGGFQDNRSATQTAAGVVTVNPATRIIERSVPGYWRFDARAALKLNEHLDLAVNAQNLTNETYFNQVFTTHYAGIAPGRTIFGTVTVKY
ncbi:TonB-dependent siderophore receptor [Sphingomonas sp. TZW2008]|uniref:TonB-dependent receptor n=1 Tax=Sphingomonas sp. TZW2008 TaxID=1917973 RepID=UPI002119C1FF|nr:TonB-dependent receptor [Sphingomonas sp. TZW2008]